MPLFYGTICNYWVNVHGVQYPHKDDNDNNSLTFNKNTRYIQWEHMGALI